MKQKIYTIDGKKYRQGVMSVDQIKAFLKLLKELGMAQLIGEGKLEFNMIFDQIIEHDKIEEFFATVLIPNEQTRFDKQKYAENLESFGVVDGDLIAEVVEDFLSFNESWWKRLDKQMDKMKAPAAETATPLTLTN